MASRSINIEGETWDVWDVIPQSALYGTDAGKIGKGLEHGWLCFQCGTRRKRVSPIPAGWASAEEADLRELFERAGPAPRSRIGTPPGIGAAELTE